jgi:hypothetical protein
MDSRNPFLKGFKKLKRKLAGGSRKRDGRDGGEADIEGSEASRRNSQLHPEVEGVESGPNRERNDVDGGGVGQVGPPTSTSSIPHSGELDGM